MEAEVLPPDCLKSRVQMTPKHVSLIERCPLCRREDVPNVLRPTWARSTFASSVLFALLAGVDLTLLWRAL